MREPRLSEWAQGGWRSGTTLAIIFFSGSLLVLSACDGRRSAAQARPLAVAASVDASVPATETPVELPAEVLAAFAPLPARFEPDAGHLTDAQIEAGRTLYFDARWSASGKVSCASCHDLANFGSDRRAVAQGAAGKSAPRNTPTVLNVAGASRFGWLGQHSDLEKFLELHIQQTLAPPAAKAPRQANQALGAFVRTLVTPTRFDAFLSGNRQALSNLEKSGLLVFFQYCAECHRGMLLGGDRMAKLGVKHPYVDPNPDAGVGLASVTRRDEDRWQFRVPPLRNVGETGPYLHHGAVPTLRGAMEMMGWLQQSVMFSEKDAAALTAFLGTLSGTVPAAAVPSKPQ